MQSLKADGKVNFLDFCDELYCFSANERTEKASHTMGVYIMSLYRKAFYAISVHTMMFYFFMTYATCFFLYLMLSTVVLFQ